LGDIDYFEGFDAPGDSSRRITLWLQEPVGGGQRGEKAEEKRAA